MSHHTYPLERDEILIPTNQGYRLYPLMVLLGLNRTVMAGRTGIGMGRARFITNSSPYQHGQSVQGMRWNTRVIQILIQESQAEFLDYWKYRGDYIELLRPSRSFITEDKLVKPFLYRKYLPGGDIIHGSDMVASVGSSIVTSPTGFFVHRGGLGQGSGITIGGADYGIAEALSDSELRLTKTYGGVPGSTVPWRYVSNPQMREIQFILEAGLDFNESASGQPVPHGFVELLRLRCHDPLFRGPVQSKTWAIPTVFGDLIFDGAGAWFGVDGITGRWVFHPDYINQTTDVVYSGHDTAKPTIEIAGPAFYPSISNVALASTLNLDYDIEDGETVIIDVDTLSVVNNRGVNLLGYLRGNLAGFGLVPEPAAPGGRNTFSVTFGKATVNSAAKISWRNVYTGL